MNQFIPSIDQLPQPPVWQSLLFEQPLGLVGVLFIAALCVFIVLNRREQAKLGAVVGGGLAAMAVAVFVIASVVTTDLEQVRDGTVALINSAATGDSAGASDHLAPDAKLNLSGMATFQVSREGLLAAVDAMEQDVGVRDHGILEKTASIDGPNAARSRVVVRVTIEGAGPTFSSWEMAWRRESDGVWRVTRLECLSVNARSPGAAIAGALSRYSGR